MCFYDNLSALCKKKEISISCLLATLGMSASNKQKWQKGATVNSAALLKIADYLDCSVDYLLGRTDNPYFEKAVPPEEKVTKQDLQAMIDQLETLKNRIIE